MSITYEKSGVNIDVADAAKLKMREVVATGSDRVLSGVGAFASLFDISFPEIKHPVLVLKTEEPGSKQKLSIARGKTREICFDMINHLTNDILVMGATPLAVQDAIICGKFESETVGQLVRGIAEACKANGSVLTGGETSEQPSVVDAGTYILTSSIVGIVERGAVVDGGRIEKGDAVLALASNGVHTNGYSFLRMMMAEDPNLENELIEVEGGTFIDAILRPHRSYYNELTPLFADPDLRGMAHITGGGIAGNLNRILPAGTDAEIDLSLVRVLPIFRFIKKRTDAPDAELFKTFNMGVGMAVVVKRGTETKFIGHFAQFGLNAYKIGVITGGNQKVNFTNKPDYEN
ncbi:MAG: phosphoribosylformylglycinamidine cyclo-ligase [Firmicutes bacterium]|nr:phosphoribosylformylglycinamidine cyclo-ligase [Bacillota bacterium]